MDARCGCSERRNGRRTLTQYITTLGDGWSGLECEGDSNHVPRDVSPVLLLFVLGEEKEEEAIKAQWRRRGLFW